MKQISINGTELNYTEQGEGVPVLFVHGSLADYRTWDFQMEPFAEHFRAISYSRRYHYPNQFTGDSYDYSAALHAADLSAFISEMGIAPVHIVASSFGAYIALYMTNKNPELVRSLVLGEPPLMPWLDDIEGGKIFKEEFFNNAFLPSKKAFADGNIEDGVFYFIDGVMGRGTYARLSPKAKTLMMDNANAMKAETVARDYFSRFTFRDAENIKCPALLLTGKRSPRLFHLITEKLHQCLPHNEVVTVPESSHSMQVANPQFYNKKVIEFLLRI